MKEESVEHTLKIIIEKFAPRPYYFAATKGNTQLVRELDEAIEIIDQVQPSLLDVLFERFFRNTRYTFSLTEQQKEFIQSKDLVRVLCVDNDAPYVYQKNGKPAGMLISVLNDFGNIL